MAPNATAKEPPRRMTRGAAKTAKLRLPEYKDSSMVTWLWCLVCRGSKRPGFYTKCDLRRHYVKHHELDFPSDKLPTSTRELRLNSNYCVSCNFHVTDLIEHQTMKHVPKNFRRYGCAVCDERFVLDYQLERHLKLNECRKRLPAIVKPKNRSKRRRRAIGR